MHGREGEEKSSDRRHMWPVPVSGTSPVATDSDFAPITSDSFSKDGRKIFVGDCALFKPPYDSPPFIGIIRRLIISDDNSLNLCVSWLYRPADIKLEKGISLEAAPNEVFYSFHKDETPAASLLHPCKVAFLCKGVELPSGISSFVCRRVYDINLKRLWWLTDQNYVNYSSTQERQEEVDQLLDKTRIEMNGTVQQGGRSPKSLNGPTGSPQLKPGSDSAQNSSSSYHSQAKGKKRELVVQGSDSVKRTCRVDDADSGQLRPEHMLKQEIAKITDRGGLVDFEGVEKFVQLMQPDSSEKKLDLTCRVMLANVIAVTDRFDCLTRFVQLRGLPVLDDWLQQVHKGKFGDVSSPKEKCDKSVDEFLLAMLRALDKLPVNLHALQTCNVGKSVNHLRTHKNSEIQKKARSLVDTWKKRVEAEMNMIDSKSGSSRGGSWPTKSVISEASNVVGRQNGGLSEPDPKNSSIQCCASKAPPAKVVCNDKLSLGSPGLSKQSPSATAPGIGSMKDLNPVPLVGAGSSDPPLTTIKEDKSSSSSHSQNNSQSCSSDYAKAASGREDARSSTAGSMSVNKKSSGVSRHRKPSNGLPGTPVHGIQKETSTGKFSSISKTFSSEKVSPTRITSERTPDALHVDNDSNQRLIVRLPNIARSPACSASGGSPEDVSAVSSQGSPQVLFEKLENRDRKLRVRSETVRRNNALNANTDICQVKDGLHVSDDANVSSVHFDEQSRDGECFEKVTETSKATCSPSGITVKSGKSHEASYSSIDALADSCVKISEADVTASVGDDVGMNLLASVAAGEMSRSDVSPSGSSGRKSSVPEESCAFNGIKPKQAAGDRVQSEDQHTEGSSDGALLGRASSDNCLHLRNGTQRADVQMPNNLSGDIKAAVLGCEVKTAECGAQLCNSNIAGPSTCNDLVSTVHDRPPESIQADSAPISSEGVKQEFNVVGNGADQYQEGARNLATTCARDDNASNTKLNGRSPTSIADKDNDSSNEKSKEKGPGLSETAATCAKVKAKANEQSSSCSSSDRCEDDKNKLSGTFGKSEDAQVVPGLVCTVAGSDTKQSEDQKLGFGSRIVRSASTHGNPEKKDVNGFHGGGSSPTESHAVPVKDTEQSIKSDGLNSDRAEESAFRPNGSSVPVSGSDMTVKLDFDLNEGLPIDDGSSGEVVKFSAFGNLSSAPLPGLIPISISSVAGGLPSSITVAAAAKGAFVPPENPLRIKGQLGWKGSAATSAFRPAEPRKFVDIPVSAVHFPSIDNLCSKQGRPLLDFDLNIPDQRVLEEVAPQNLATTRSESGRIERNAGLNLDLNRCDDSLEIGQFSVSNSCRLEVSKLPSCLPGGLSFSESNALRGFDLNNGPGPDEVGNDAVAAHANNGVPFLSSVSTVRMNNMELGNFSWWNPPGTSYSAIGMPPALPSRSDQNYPTHLAGSSQRIMGLPGSASFSPDLYSGPVLSSSPAVGYPPNTPFQYPGFPFETSFPLSSNSYSGVTTPYADSSSGGPHCIPAIPSQLMGPAGMISTHYPRPFVMSLPGSASNAPDTRKWGSQGLDLNSGPGVAEVDWRDDRFPSALRKFPLTGSQPLSDEQLKMYHMSGGILKRKEPDGAWDGDRISYKHPPWQ